MAKWDLQRKQVLYQLRSMIEVLEEEAPKPKSVVEEIWAELRKEKAGLIVYVSYDRINMALAEAVEGIEILDNMGFQIRERVTGIVSETQLKDILKSVLDYLQGKKTRAIPKVRGS